MVGFTKKSNHRPRLAVGFSVARHFDNMEDDSAGIFYSEEGSGLAWLWDSIQHIVGLFVHNMATTSRHSIPLYSTTENPTAR
jgi:hypothetical protein